MTNVLALGVGLFWNESEGEIDAGCEDAFLGGQLV
jgi:hypothetical protein